MRRLISTILLASALPAFATCTGASPTWTSTPDEASVQTCVTNSSSGDTINVSAGTATWSSALVLSGKALNLIGASVITGTGDPNVCTAHTGCITATDNTVITLGLDQTIQITGTATNFVRLSGFTFIAGVSAGHGAITPQGPLTGAGFRLDHIHFQMPISDSIAIATSDYGLVDHVWFEDTTPSGAGATPFNLDGLFSDKGYSNWNQATGLGTNNAVIVEQNYYTTSHTNTEGFYDGYFGVKAVVRFNTLVGQLHWWLPRNGFRITLSQWRLLGHLWKLHQQRRPWRRLDAAARRHHDVLGQQSAERRGKQPDWPFRFPRFWCLNGGRVGTRCDWPELDYLQRNAFELAREHRHTECPCLPDHAYLRGRQLRAE